MAQQTPAEAHAEAIARIQAAKASGQTWLDLGDLGLEAIPAEIACLDKLQDLSLGMHGITEKDDTTNFEADYSRIEGQLRDLSILTSLKPLRSLCLSRCYVVRDLSPLKGLTRLENLYLSECLVISDLSPLAKLINLETLDLSWCSDISDFSVLEGLTALQSLDLTGCDCASYFNLLGGLTRLRSLKLAWSPGISDLTPLARLTKLQSLDLGGCPSISDLSPLTMLTKMMSLDISGCEGISDLSPLTAMTALQRLSMSACFEIDNLGPIVELTALRSLHLSCHSGIDDFSQLSTLTKLHTLLLNDCSGLSELSFLRGLTNLRRLHLGEFSGVSDLSPLSELSKLRALDLVDSSSICDLTPLAELTNLRRLNIIRCSELKNISPLASLRSLRSLSLSGCTGISNLTPLTRLIKVQTLYLSGCPGISDLTPLTGLRNLLCLYLNDCQGLSDLSPMAKLTTLHSLDLSRCSGISDLSPLIEVTNLQLLHVAHCSGISDFSPLTRLTNLRRLNLSGCRTKQRFYDLLYSLSQLSYLYLFQSEWIDLPSVICGKDDGDDVLHLVCAHFADLSSGRQVDIEKKVMVLGNGSVGKTQLARRLRGLPFDPTVPTTHGIELGSMNVPVRSVENPVVLNLWDFGGQDIYHGAHSLFLQRDAIYLILWNPKCESGSQFEAGHEMPHRPLTYWLDFVRSIAGCDAPVLVIQTQCDRPSDRVSQIPASLDGFSYTRCLACSAATDHGLKILVAELEEALEDMLERRGLDEIGSGRLAVRQQLRDLLAQDKPRPRNMRQSQMLSVGQFSQICNEVGGVSDPMALLDYLHTTGMVYYRPEVMRDRLVLDQNWAFEGIYTLFNRQKTLPVLKKLGGKFSRADLDCLIWEKFSVEEQELFLEVMQACGMCFPTRRIRLDQRMEQEFVAPDLLPENPESKHHILSHLITATDAEVEIQYPFLHEGILRSLLSEIGRHIGQDGVFWKYGCWFYEQRRGSELVLDSVRAPQTLANDYSGTLKLRAWKGAAAELVELVVKIVTSLSIGQPPVIRWLRGHPSRGLDRQQSPALLIPANTSEPVTDPAELPPLKGSLAPLQDAKARPEVFISYAWGDDKSPEGIEREQTVNQLEDKLREWGYEPIRDKKVLRNGDLLSAFMVSLAKGDRVLVILSGAYLKSEACMTEVNGLFKTADRDKTKFLKRIIPVVLSDAEISQPKARADHAKFWHAKKVEMHADFDYLGSADKQRLCMISEWVQQIGDILAFISDELHPHGYEQIIENDFAGVRELIERKVAGE